MTRETPHGDGLYIDNRCNSWLWRGRVNRKPTRKTIRHEATGVVATTDNMTKTEARRIAKAMTADAASGAGRYFDVTPLGEIRVRDAWKTYMERLGDKLTCAPEKVSHWTRFIEPKIGDMLLSKVTRKDCAVIIDNALSTALARKENGNVAVNLQKNMKAFFAWCADGGYGATGLEASPMSAFKEKPIDTTKTKRPSHSLSAADFRIFFKALQRFQTRGRSDGREQRKRSARAIELLVRSMCRRDEIFVARWGWVEADGLHLPRTKRVGKKAQGFAMLLPLTPSMKALIGDRPEEAADDARIFVVGSRAISEGFEEVRRIMTEVAREEGSNRDYHTAKFDGEHNPDFWTLHDARDSGKRYLNEDCLGADGMPKFRSEFVEGMLNHREKGIAAIYNSTLESPRYLYAQRVVLGQEWNRWLDGLTDEPLSPVALAA